MKKFKHPIAQAIHETLVSDLASWEIGSWRAIYKRTGLALGIDDGLWSFETSYLSSDERKPEVDIKRIPTSERRRLLKLFLEIRRLRKEEKDSEAARKFVASMRLPYSGGNRVKRLR